jgi:hypothetical protein
MIALPSLERLDERRLVVLTLVAFWIYVIASRVVVRAVWLSEIQVPQMAPLDIYAAQHVLTLPFLVLAYWWAWRIGWQRDRAGYCLLMHTLIAIAVAVVARLALFVSRWLLVVDPAVPWHAPLRDFASEFAGGDLFWLVTFTEFTFQYLCGLGLCAAIVSWRRYQQQTAARQAQASELVNARLSALRRQLDPHFLFNTLNGIAATVDENPQRGNEMLLRLSALLRATIADDRQVIPLREELETARRYLELHAMRFPDRLRIHIASDPAVEECEVPPLLLQPLVENAALHGLESGSRGVRIEVSSHAESDQRLRIDVVNSADSGIVLPEPRRSPGIGLRNTWDRLEAYYGRRFEFTLERPDATHVRARLIVPCV